jgi:hypothetical protein
VGWINWIISSFLLLPVDRLKVELVELVGLEME